MKKDSRMAIKDEYLDRLRIIDKSLVSASIDAKIKMDSRHNPPDPDTWVKSGLSLCQGSWNSIQVANLFFNRLPCLVECVSADAMDEMMEFIVTLSKYSTSLAAGFLKKADSTFATLSKTCHKHFLHLGNLVITRSKADIWPYLEQLPQLLSEFHKDQSLTLLTLANQLLDTNESPSVQEYLELVKIILSLDERNQARTIRLSTDLARIDPMAAVEFVKSVPVLLDRSPQFSLESWLKRGLDSQSMQRFFKMESRESEEVVGAMSGRLELSSIKGLLQLYSYALAGNEIHLTSSSQLTATHLGWSSKLTATTDGTTIYVPAFIDRYSVRQDNLQLYKAMVTHQAGRIWFGSFLFQYGAAGYYLESSLEPRYKIPGNQINSSESASVASHVPLVPLQAFFDLFSDRLLIESLFALVEDSRVDHRNQEEYGGLQKFMKKIKLEELDTRPNMNSLGMRQAFIENLLRFSLDHIESIDWPEALKEVMTASISALGILYNEHATVQDSSEVGAYLYDIAISIPNVPASQVVGIWSAIGKEDFVRDLESLPVLPLVSFDIFKDLVEIPFHANVSSVVSGDFKPELAQVINQLNSSQEVDAVVTDQLAHLLANSVEIDEAISTDSFLREVCIRADDDSGGISDSTTTKDNVEDTKQFSYDEWDFRSQDYLSNWCKVREVRLQEGQLNYYDEVLDKYSLLVKDIRRQFEYLKPDCDRKIDYLDDGSDIDLDKSIQFLVEKKSGTGPRARIYTRKNKTERDLAIAFLLDMSASTNESIEQSKNQSTHAGLDTAKHKRIIDLEKEAIILMIEALETVGDTYSIYGFSGRFKENVSFYSVKEICEPLDDSAKKRIQSIEPLQATRMGAAIRHCASKLMFVAKKSKILILLSDGRPRDQDYGIDQNDTDFAINDTRQALTEARSQGISPFLITVDEQGNDYLQKITGGFGYEVIANIESLPKRLPDIYRHLTSNF